MYILSSYILTFDGGYWVSRENFDSAMKRKGIRSSGKLKSNAWTISALVSPTTKDRMICSDDDIAKFEGELIPMVSVAIDQVISAIRSERGLEHTKINHVEVDVTDSSLPYYENQLNALGFFATNHIDEPLPEEAISVQ